MPEDEPPLHRAVINDDLIFIKKWVKDQKSLDEKNALGFRAIEIAQFF